MLLGTLILEYLEVFSCVHLCVHSAGCLGGYLENVCEGSGMTFVYLGRPRGVNGVIKESWGMK